MRHHFLFLFLIVFFAVGCGFDPNSIVPLPEISEPPPVTPITAPDGIRDTIYRDANALVGESQEKADFFQFPQEVGSPDLCGGSSQVTALPEDIGRFSALISVQTCGWTRIDRPIEVELTLPDGSIVNDAVAPDRIFNRPVATYNYRIDHVVATQTYSLRFSNGDGAISAEVTVNLPDTAGIYLLPDSSVWLHNFAPNETVDLYRFDVAERHLERIEEEGRVVGSGLVETLRLTHFETQSVTEDGTLHVPNFLVMTDDPFGQLAIAYAIGAESGEVKTIRPITTNSIQE